MNIQRRREVNRIIASLDELCSQLVGLCEDISSKQEEEEEARESLPESIQNGQQGERMQEAADHLMEAASKEEEVTDLIREMMEELEEAVACF